MSATRKASPVRSKTKTATARVSSHRMVPEQTPTIQMRRNAGSAKSPAMLRRPAGVAWLDESGVPGRMFAELNGVFLDGQRGGGASDSFGTG